MEKRTQGIIAAIFNYLFIGLSFLFTKQAVAIAPVFVVLSYRFLVSFIILTIVMIVTKNFHKILPVLKTHWKMIGAFAIFQPLLFFSFQAFALQRIDSSEAGIISAISPSIIAILGIIFLNEKLNSSKIIGLVLTFGGLLFIYLFRGAFKASTDIIGIIFIIIATISGCIYQILGRKLSSDSDPLSLAYFRIVLGAIVFPLMAWIFGDWKTHQPLTIIVQDMFILAILFLAIFTTVGTSILTIYSLKRLYAVEQGIFSSIATIISIFAGILFLKEIFVWYQAIGSVFVIMGVVFMNLGKKIKMTEKID